MRTFTLERRTGDSRKHVGLGTGGGTATRADQEIGSLAGDISLYLAPRPPGAWEPELGKRPARSRSLAASELRRAASGSGAEEEEEEGGSIFSVENRCREESKESGGAAVLVAAAAAAAVGDVSRRGRGGGPRGTPVISRRVPLVCVRVLSGTATRTGRERERG